MVVVVVVVVVLPQIPLSHICSPRPVMVVAVVVVAIGPYRKPKAFK